MRILALLSAFVLVVGVAHADRDWIDMPVKPDPLPCDMDVIAFDWDFDESDHAFEVVACEPGGTPVWEYGTTDAVLGGWDPLWGVNLAGIYPDGAGAGLLSPSFVVGDDSRFVRVFHQYDIEADYDGCNVSLERGPESSLLTPTSGYPTLQISPDPARHAFCVDGEAGWTGASGVWKVDCFDLSDYMGSEVRLRFDFGADDRGTDRGWFIGRIVVGGRVTNQAACCDPASGSCTVMTESECLALGREWHPEWGTCSPNPCPVPLTDVRIALDGIYSNPEPWHDYIPAVPGARIPITFYERSLDAEIDYVEFFSSIDSGMSWQLFGVDHDGTQPVLDTYGEASYPNGDGWSAVFEPPIEPGRPDRVLLRTRVHTSGRVYEARTERDLDYHPPSMSGCTISDFVVNDSDTMGVQILPGGTEIGRVLLFVMPTDYEFVKGVPGINQHMYSDDHCAPTAAAQCLKYFEETYGDYYVTNGLDDYGLVGALAEVMNTREGEGTLIDDWTGGLTEWLDNVVTEYTVRVVKHYTEEGVPTWTPEDWRLMRNELERCQDVLVAVFWDGGGAHALTLNSIVNADVPEEIWVGFKDPWTGTESYATLDGTTGFLSNVGGAGGGEASGYIGATMIVCPRATALEWSGPGELVAEFHPSGPPPYEIRVPTIEEGLLNVHFVVENTSHHAHRISRIVRRIMPVANPAEVGTDGSDLAFHLGYPRPNPFHGRTEITYNLPAEARVGIWIYDLTGRKIRTLLDADVSRGMHSVAWDGSDGRFLPAAPGVYFVKMSAPGYERVRAVTLIR